MSGFQSGVGGPPRAGFCVSVVALYGFGRFLKKSNIEPLVEWTQYYGVSLRYARGLNLNSLVEAVGNEPTANHTRNSHTDRRAIL